MRRLQLVAVATTTVMLTSGCAVTKREWGSCTFGGAALGAVAGGITGGVLVNNLADSPNNARRGGAIAGGIVGGAAIGGLLGHLLCDPIKEAPVVQAEAPPPAPPPSGTEIAELRGTHFAFDSAHLTAEGEAALDETVATMREHGSLHVRVEGNTDSVGSEAYNQDLGQRRADAVRDYLVGQGIDGSRITTVSFGESRPVADNSTAAGRAENRRVEIVVE